MARVCKYDCGVTFQSNRGKAWKDVRIKRHYDEECPRAREEFERKQRQLQLQSNSSDSSYIPASARLANGVAASARPQKRRRDERDYLLETRPRKKLSRRALQVETAEEVSVSLPDMDSGDSFALEFPISSPLPRDLNTLHPMDLDTNTLSNDAPISLEATLEPISATGQLPPTRSGRKRRLPARFREVAPAGPNKLQIPTTSPDHELEDVPETPKSRAPYESVPNIFGLSRQYPSKPSDEPDVNLGARDFFDTRSDNRLPQPLLETVVPSTRPGTAPATVGRSPIWPFNNVSELLLLNWFYTGGAQKSLGERNALVQDVLQSKYFVAEEVTVSGLNTVENELKDANSNPSHPLFTGETWRRASVPISIPRTKSTPLNYSVPGLVYRSITNIVIAALKKSRPPSSALHYTPFKTFWESPTPKHPSHVERVFDELYSSDVWLREHEAIQNLPPELNSDGTECTRERAVAGLMLWSDATQFANFGTAKLWPIYMFLGNQSKFQRNKGSARECHHVAYIPSLPDTLLDFLKKQDPPINTLSSQLKAHLRRELFHAIWKLLLDDDFVHAYVHGVPVDCGDGEKRRMYIRLFSYSADYPEKALIALIRDNGLCPCPLCKLRREDIHKLGMVGQVKELATLKRVDDEHRRSLVMQARALIYSTKGVALSNKNVEALLKGTSLVPTLNAFSERLGNAGFDFHEMIVPDIMHENLLGTWKALLLVIIRLLHALHPAKVAEFNERFRLVPTFGRDSIRNFSDNVSDTRNMTAARYQDALVCILPVVDGLIPEYDALLQSMIFCAVNWLSLAKLHIHSESTLHLLTKVMKDYGRLTRQLAKDTVNVKMVETPREAEIRRRRKVPGSTATSEPGLKPKPITNSTFKLHNMTHYVWAIMFWGTPDSFTTAIGETEHKTGKTKWRLSNHQDFEWALGAALSVRDLVIRLFDRISSAISYYHPASTTKSGPSSNELDRVQDKTSTLPGDLEDDTGVDSEAANSDASQNLGPKVIMGKSQNDHLRIQTILKDTSEPAYKDFLPKLKDHILIRLGLAKVGDDISDTQRLQVSIVAGLFLQKTCRINYNTYDVRRGQDTIHCTTPKDEKCNIMVYAGEEDSGPTHPFWYARVLMIFTAQIRTPDSPHGVEMRFLWVRWFGRDMAHSAGWKKRRLDRIGYLADADDPFGFVDPEDVVCAAHLIPAFKYGRTTTLLRQSRFRHREGDWAYYYVNRFAERDMMMRYTDLAIGHNRPRSSEPQGLYERTHEVDEASIEAPEEDEVLGNGHEAGISVGSAAALERGEGDGDGDGDGDEVEDDWGGGGGEDGEGDYEPDVDSDQDEE